MNGGEKDRGPVDKKKENFKYEAKQRGLMDSHSCSKRDRG